MPEFLKDILEAEAARKGFKGRKKDAYVFGTMNNNGSMHGNKETAKGARMQAKHDRQAAEGLTEADREARRRAQHRSVPQTRGRPRAVGGRQR